MTLEALPESITFDQGQPFYDMLSAFVIAVVGLESVLNPRNPMQFKKDQFVTLEGKVHPELRIEPYLVHRLGVENKVPIPHTIHSLTSMLVNTAYETVKNENDQSPAFEFFRHVRNASSHNNKFHFFPTEPSRKAAWRNRVIDNRQKGKSNPLHGTQCFGSYLGVADAIVLLWDIEQRL